MSCLIKSFLEWLVKNNHLMSIILNKRKMASLLSISFVVFLKSALFPVVFRDPRIGTTGLVEQDSKNFFRLFYFLIEV